MRKQASAPIARLTGDRRIIRSEQTYCSLL
jgi:hypothetical protein